MKIGMLGTGNIGFSLGPLLLKAGHEVKFGSRDPQHVERELGVFGSKASAGTFRDAAQFGEAILTAVPWHALPDVLAVSGPLKGRLVVDCTNALKNDLTGALPAGTSAGEQVAKMAPDARVVKAFNTIFASVYKSGNLKFGGQPLTMPYAGDDPRAKATVAELIESVGLAPLDAGPLVNARHLEALTLLLLHFAVAQGMGMDIAWSLARR